MIRPVIRVPKKTLPDLTEPHTLQDLFQIISSHKKEELFRWKEEKQWKSLSSDECIQRVKAFACHLKDSAFGYRIQKGEHVAFLVYNGPEWHIVRMACARIGAVSIPILTEISDHDLEIILTKARPKLICVKDKMQESKIRKALERLHTDIPILHYTINTELPQTALTDFYESAKEDDLAMIFFTSGTTSDPKGVMHTHKSLLTNVNTCKQVFTVRPDDVVLSFLPVSHIFQQAVDTLALTVGATIAYTTPDQIRTTLPEINPTVMASVPKQFENMKTLIPMRIKKELKRSGKVKQLLVPLAMRMGEKNFSPKLADRIQARLTNWFLRPVRQKVKTQFLPRMRFFVSGGAHLEPSIGAFTQGALEIPIYQGWGMTEVAGAGTCNTPKENALGSCGKPLPGVEIKIEPLSQDLQEGLPEGAGEVWIRGPIVTSGYYNEPEATRTSFQDNWFKTGDIGKLDKNGNLWIAGRKKGIIVLESGLKVHEEALAARIRSTCPLIEQIVIFGHTKPRLVALAYPNVLLLKEQVPGPLRTESKGWTNAVKHAISAQLKTAGAGLAPHEQIARIYLMEEPLSKEDETLTGSEKPRHHVIQQKYGNIIESMYK